MDKEVESQEIQDQCHGDHWGAVILDSEEIFLKAIRESIEKGKLICSKDNDHLLYYTPKDRNGEKLPVAIKAVLSTNHDKSQVVTAYPCAVSGSYVFVKIVEITEWENGLEATIEGITDTGNMISFFDTDYFLHKSEYKVGECYWFSLAGLVYNAEVFEKGAADFEFTGQEAIDFKAKTGEEAEYDENGNVKPIHFCLDNLVSFLPRECKADAEFQSPLVGSKNVCKFFGTKLITGYSIKIYLDEDGNGNDVLLPIIVAQDNLEGKAREKKACRGVLWLHGHIVPNEEVEKFQRFKQLTLEHLDSLLNGKSKKDDFEKDLIPLNEEEPNEHLEANDAWNDIVDDEEEQKDRVIFTYDKVPFNMLGIFKSFEFWDKDLIIACINFKKKYDKWPTAILTSESTYERWEEVIQENVGEYIFDNEFDDDFDYEQIQAVSTSGTIIALSEEDHDEYWNKFDTNIPLDEITPEELPIEFGEDFATPFFRLNLLIDNNYAEGMFRLMYGEGPGGDDGEEIPESKEKTA